MRLQWQISVSDKNQIHGHRIVLRKPQNSRRAPPWRYIPHSQIPYNKGLLNGNRGVADRLHNNSIPIFINSKQKKKKKIVNQFCIRLLPTVDESWAWCHEALLNLKPPSPLCPDKIIKMVNVIQSRLLVLLPFVD